MNPNDPDDENPAGLVDMQTNSDYIVSDLGIQSLLIVYSPPEAEKGITDIKGPAFEPISRSQEMDTGQTGVENMLQNIQPDKKGSFKVL